MILLTAIGFGLLAGIAQAKYHQTTWQLPQLQHAWIVAVFILPQVLAFYLPVTRSNLSVAVVSACLIFSQVGLLLFCLINWRQPGIIILAAGLLLNLLVIVGNGGFMPLSTDTAARLVPAQTFANMKVGSRVSLSSKDILLQPETIIFPWLSDRFIPPDWFPYKFAFSIGDVFIGLGAFLLLSLPTSKVSPSQERKF